MGNSCSLQALSKKSPKYALVILPGGEVRRFSEPTKAAEVMMECPNFFLTSFNDLHIGQRFRPLSADEDIVKGGAYIMFPMKRATSIATAADTALAFLGTNTPVKRVGTGLGDRVKISPEISGSDSNDTAPTGSEEKVLSCPASITLEGFDEFLAPENKYRLSICRSKRPSLETIKEETIKSR